ncbi:MAG TPA: hypothetical protein VHI11_03880, partial [Jiangellaceae bacterium]|nr:hypothetical protein [Jiangellaceae bacterium]
MVVTRAARTAAIASLIVLAACGSEDPAADTAAGSPDPSTTPEAADFPVTVEAANGEVVVEAQPT